MTLLTYGAVILKYAGNDATAAYEEIHAPGIIEESLSQEAFKGLLDQADIINLPQDQQDDTDRIEKTTGQTPPSLQWQKPELHKLISLHDFEEVAERTLTEKAWAFYSSAATDLVTHHANSKFFRRIMLRPRVMRSVPEAKTTRMILGFHSEVPFFVSPAAMARLAHKDGELAMARGCASEGIIQCVRSPNCLYLRSMLTPVFFRSQATLPTLSLTSLRLAARTKRSSSSFMFMPIGEEVHN